MEGAGIFVGENVGVFVEGAGVINVGAFVDGSRVLGELLGSRVEGDIELGGFEEGAYVGAPLGQVGVDI